MDDPKKKGKLAKWKVRAGEFKEKALHQGEKWMNAATEKKHELSEEWKEKRRRGKENGDGEIRPIFGATLADAVEWSRIDDNCALPAVMIRCIEYLDGKGLHEVGLYRIPGSTTAVANLKAVFDQGEDLDFLLEEEPIDVHSVATLLKMYLRELPENILSNLLNDFTTLISNEDSLDVEQVSLLAQQLPLPNYYLLSWLCSHLARLVYYSDVNKMTLNNLALIFCPTLHMDNLVFTFFVNNVVEVFPMDDDGMPSPSITDTSNRLNGQNMLLMREPTDNDTSSVDTTSRDVNNSSPQSPIDEPADLFRRSPNPAQCANGFTNSAKSSPTKSPTGTVSSQISSIQSPSSSFRARPVIHERTSSVSSIASHSSFKSITSLASRSRSPGRTEELKTH